jgi:hypothetical protein
MQTYIHAYPLQVFRSSGIGILRAELVSGGSIVDDCRWKDEVGYDI